jgi:hypothetical protein
MKCLHRTSGTALEGSGAFTFLRIIYPFSTNRFPLQLRRICPGRYTADASIWVAMVTILSTLTVSKVLDDKGREIDVDPKFTCGVTSWVF